MPEPESLLLYLLLVLLPQLLWVLSNSSGVAVCESCSFFWNSPAGHHYGVDQRNSSSNSTSSVTHLTTSSNSSVSSSITAVSVTISSVHTIHGVSGESKSLAPEYHDPVVASLCSCDVNHRPQTRGRVRGKENSFSVDGWISNLTTADQLTGGWHSSHTLPDLSGPCTLQRRNSSLSEEEFLEHFAYKEPVVLTGTPDQTLFRAHSTKLRLLLDYGHEVITVATANTNSYHRVRMSLCEYIDSAMKPQTYDCLGNETLYHFGDNDRESWSGLFQLYLLPPYRLPGMEPVLSFGLAGPHTGVPFHIHGPTFAETIYGRKRWFLYPPAHRPVFHPDVSTLHWATYTLPFLPAEERPLECTLGPGEVLYFPDSWWHATLNVDTTVFMSTFYSS